MGVISGVLISKLIGLLKTNFHNMFIVLGISAGLIITGSFHYINYLFFRSGLNRFVEAELIATYGPSAKMIVRQVVDQIILTETGKTGILGYLNFIANQGFSIRTISYLHILTGANEVQKTGSVFVWVYWILSFLIVTAVSINVSRRQSTKTTTKEKFLGEVKVKDTELLINLIQQKDFSNLKEILVEEAGIPCLFVSLLTLNNKTNSGTWIVIKRMVPDDNGKYYRQIIFSEKIEAEQVAEIQQI
jgi:hypothetical protein